MSRTSMRSGRWTGAWALAAVVLSAPLWAHHSFASFDTSKTLVFTGVVTRVNPDANHLQIYFAPMNEERRNVLREADGKTPVIWEVEMAGSAQSAEQGISVSSFPPGTVFSVALNPTRNGDTKGLRVGAMYKCPVITPPKPTPPEAGKHCDSVKGNEAFGTGALPAPTN